MSSQHNSGRPHEATFYAAPRIAQNGWRPVPLRARTKVPAISDWPHYELREGDELAFVGCGIGLLLGNGVIAVDVDVRHPEAAERIEALAKRILGDGLKRTGAAPKFALLYHTDAELPYSGTCRYRMAGDSPDAKAHRVEVLTEGKQLVAFGVHPDTGRPYEWNGSGSPLDRRVDSLPLVDAEKIGAFLREADAVLAATGERIATRELGPDSGEHAASDLGKRARNPAEFRDALRYLPNDYDRDGWIRLAHSIKAALGPEGWPEFEAWCKKSASYTGRDTKRVWDSLNPTTATAGTLLREARLRGWRPKELPQERPAGESGWPEPVDILAEFAAPELRPELMPPALSEFPAAFATASGHDPTLTLTAALGAAAAALSDEFQIVANPETAWRQSARLWILSVARPGTGKTPTQKEMLAPLWAVHAELGEQWRHSVEGLDKNDPKPPRPRVVLGDVTIEALSEALRDNARGLLLATDEFESWLGSLDVYRRGGVSRDRGEWLRLYDGGPHSIERIQRGPVFVPNWGASILTATTPATLAKLSRELPEDGLLQRFLVFVARAICDGSEVPELHALRERYAETIRRLYAAAPNINGGRVRLSRKAREFFNEWVKQTRVTAEAFGSIEPALESHLVKGPTFLLRIALTFHAVNLVQNERPGVHDVAVDEVPLETIELAARFLAAARQHAVAVYVGRSGSETYHVARDVARAILAHGWATAERRQLIQTVRAFRGAEGDRQDAVLRLLSDVAWLQPAEGGYAKDTPARYAVNPAVHRRWAALAERERKRRAAVRDVIAECVAERRAERGAP